MGRAIQPRPSESRWYAELAGVSIVACAVLASLAGPSAPISLVRGTIDQASFPRPVTELVVEGADGSLATTPVDDAGRFTVVLRAPKRYRIFVGSPTGPPLVVRTGLHVGAVIAVDSPDADVDLGRVRYRAAGWAGTAEGAEELASARVAATIACDGPHTDQQALLEREPRAMCGDGVDTAGNDCEGGLVRKAVGHRHPPDLDEAIDVSEAIAVTSLDLASPLRCELADEVEPN